MKKILVCIAICLAFLMFQSTALAATALKMSYDGKTVNYTGISYKVCINGKEIKSDFPGIDFNKVTMFPVRAVFESLGGKVTWNSKTQMMDVDYKGTKLQFKNNDSNAKINNKTVKLSSPAKKMNDRLIVPIDFLNQIDLMNASVDKKANAININIIAAIKNVKAETAGEKDIITLEMSDNSGTYEITRHTNPNRIVVDFKNVKSYDKEKVFQVKGKYISAIKISNLKDNTSRVEVAMDDMNNFTISKIGGGYRLTIEKPLNANLEYVNHQDRIYFSIKNVKLANVAATIKNFFTEEYDLENNLYTMTIPAGSELSLAEDTFHIDDEFVEYIEIFRDKETLDTKLQFKTKKEFKFFTSYNDKYGRTEINLLSPAKEDEILVVIDAGHGGSDPGAVWGGVNEKDLNLDIALRLRELLKEAGIHIFMMREDDTFVGLYDRPHIANELNASLFLSIHNNSIDGNKKTSGTETLYFPEKAGDKAFTGQKFAQLLQESLINTLKSVNRKTVPRPELVVLKYTRMPSSLTEIGFITNAAELAKLKTEAYRQQTAQALCDAVVKSVKIIEKEKLERLALEETSEETQKKPSAKAKEELTEQVEDEAAETDADSTDNQH